MAKLLSYYSLCPINNINEFLGISRDVDPGSVINTLGKNIILVIKLNNQKQIKSWTVLDRLTNKVVYDFTKKQYVGVFAHRFLRFWDDNEEDINKIKKIKFHRKIHDLFTVEFDDRKSTLVLYQDGTCESLDCALESRLEDKHNPDVKRQLNETQSNYTIDNVKVLELANDRNQAMITYFKKYENLVELNFAAIDRETLKPTQKFQTVKLERLEKNPPNLIGYAVVDGKGRYPCLLSIWSDKRIFTQTLKYDEKNSSSNSLGNFISMIDLINVNHPISIMGINRDVVAIYAANKNNDGSFVLLYNIKFKVVQSKQYFKIFFNESKMWSIDSNIFLAFGRNLSVIPYHVSDEQLSDMVGSQCNQNVSVTVDKTINQDLEFEEAVRFSEQQPEFDGARNFSDDDFLFRYQRKPLTAQEKFIKENKIKKFHNSTEIEDQLKELYRDDIALELIRDNTQIPDTMQAKLFSNLDDNFLVLSENFELLLSEFDRQGFSEIEITAKVLPILIKTNRTADIGLLLKKYNHVSEKMLVKTLKYLVSCPEFKNKQKKKKKKSEDDWRVSPIKEKEENSEIYKNRNVFLEEKPSSSNNVDVLNILLTCSFDPKIILKYLRQEIDLNDLVYLMDYLYGIITENPLESSAPIFFAPSPVEVDDFDLDRKLFDWFTLLIDSHYQQILLSKDKVLLEKLMEWNELVKHCIDVISEMANTRSLMLSIMKGKSKQGPSQSCNKWYSVENIKLY